MSRSWWWALGFFAWATFASGSLAETVADNTYCSYEELPQSLRQTLIIIDGALARPEDGPPLPENQQWRSFASRFVDAADPFTRQNLDARERVTIAVANTDGSGLTVLFSGCVPVFSVEEEAARQGQASAVAVFFGSDWRAQWLKQAEGFKRLAVTALVSGLKGATLDHTGGAAFVDSGLVQSLAKSPGISLEYGVPRVILYTSLGDYAFPQGDVPALRRAGVLDAARRRIDFVRSELHLLTASNPASDGVRDYVDAFFLSSKARVATLTTAGGSLTPENPPISVDVYQGTVDMGDSAKYPLRMRLARDLNGTVVNSWVEMQALEARFVPFKGILSCPVPTACSYVGDNVFAQIWSDDPDPDPECPPDIPFGGLRNLKFAIDGETIAGTISDEVCFFTGREAGLTISLTLVPNGRF